MRALVAASALMLFAGCVEGGAEDIPTRRGDGGRRDFGVDFDTAEPEDLGGGEDSPIEETKSCGSSEVRCGSTCVDTMTDSANCGACGTKCMSGEVCSGGACRASCASGETRCGMACANLATDDKNCGACGTACATGESCVASACELVCASPTTKCGATCVNTSSDDSNCGACGNACPSGSTCSAGTCSTPSTTVTFPSTTSSTYSVSTGVGTLGTGGGRRFYQASDYVQQSFARSSPASKLTVNFGMSDGTTNYCFVGTLTWNVLVNSVVVGTYSWVGGTTSWSSGAMGPDRTIAQTYSFPSIAPSGGKFTIRLQATRTVCAGAGSWNWYAGGTATLQ